MGVTKRKDGRFGVYWKESGKKKWKYFRDEGQAHAYDAKRKASNADGGFSPTLGEMALSYLNDHPIHKDTRNHIKRCLKGGARTFVAKPADQLNRRDLEALREHGRDEGLSNNSINKNQAYIAAILGWAMEQDLIQFNPWAGYRKLKVKKRIPTLTLAELGEIWDVAPAWLQWAIEVTYCLAIRPGQKELFGLKWPGFRWDLGHTIVIQAKGDRPKAVIPPPAFWVEARTRYEADQAAGYEYVCHRGDGKRIKDYRVAFTKALNDAGLKNRDIRPYDIRHLAVSGALAAGADLAAAAAQAGHASPFVTGTVYSHVTAGAQRQAAMLLPIIPKTQDIVVAQNQLPPGVVKPSRQLIDITPNKRKTKAT